ncbi:MAG: hypothetical protein MK097_14095, partial [Dechloromonas sp.]|nr:hypothetical protein [Dechloromonas sp.]
VHDPAPKKYVAIVQHNKPRSLTEPPATRNPYHDEDELDLIRATDLSAAKRQWSRVTARPEN